MRPLRMFGAVLLAFVAVSAYGESKDPADYPLRIHIYNREQMTFYHNRMLDESRGEGRANLYDNGEPWGVDFTFHCAYKLRPSLTLFETYPAKWKKPNAELVVLFPEFGKTDSYFTCNLKTALKDQLYIMRGPGQLSTMPKAEFKAWIIKHDYDPEHGKHMPKRLDRPATGASPSAAPSAVPGTPTAPSPSPMIPKQ
jgi:hypothetical protein